MGKINNKGLTLVELMAVISVLAVVALIVTPNVLSSIRKSRQRLYDTQLDNIISSAKNWAADEIVRKHCLICVPESGSTKTKDACLKDGGEGCVEAAKTSGEVLNVYLSDLQDNGYIDDELINPKTDKKFNRCVKVDIKRDTNTGEFIYSIPNADTTEACNK